jgi:hypothetical protein
MYNFGADAVHQRWLDEKDAILGGRVRRVEAATLRDLLNRFLNSQSVRINSAQTGGNARNPDRGE